MATNFGKIYLEYYNGFTLYGSKAPDKGAFGITFYKQGAAPETPAGTGETGDLITSLDQLTDGATVAIYSPGHMTAISTKPNGDWYLKANAATVENGKVVNFTADFVWKVKKNDDGTFSFYANDDETHSITVWPSGTYAELSLNVGTYPDNTWTLTPAKTPNCFYANSPTVSGSRGPAYIEAYVRNEFEVFSGYFIQPTNSNFKESEFALQFYLVNPDDAVAGYDDGEWDGVLTKGKQYVAYNATAGSSIGLWDEANFSMKAIPTTIEGDKANAGNGAYVFTVDTMGRYYSFKAGGKYLATNEKEEVVPDQEGRRLHHLQQGSHLQRYPRLHRVLLQCVLRLDLLHQERGGHLPLQLLRGHRRHQDLCGRGPGSLRRLRLRGLPVCGAGLRRCLHPG